MIKEGDIAPEFELQADDGSTVDLTELRGKRVVLYFYPRADTPGCTIEACEFRDSLPDIEAKGAAVFGVSPDPVEDVRKFREKYDLTFRLLADPDHSVAEAYGVWKEKSMFGKKLWGAERTTFVIGPDGRVEKVFRRVKPAGHAQQVLSDI